MNKWVRSGNLLYRLTDEKRPRNRDEISVTMADGSRDGPEVEQRTEQLLNFLNAKE